MKSYFILLILGILTFVSCTSKKTGNIPSPEKTAKSSSAKKCAEWRPNEKTEISVKQNCIRDINDISLVGKKYAIVPTENTKRNKGIIFSISKGGFYSLTVPANSGDFGHLKSGKTYKGKLKCFDDAPRGVGELCDCAITIVLYDSKGKELTYLLYGFWARYDEKTKCNYADRKQIFTSFGDFAFSSPMYLKQL